MRLQLTTLLAASVAVASPSAVVAAKVDAPRPNIIWIMARTRSYCRMQYPDNLCV